VAIQLPGANRLATVRVTIGAMLEWVFFENLGNLSLVACRFHLEIGDAITKE